VKYICDFVSSKTPKQNLNEKKKGKGKKRKAEGPELLLEITSKSDFLGVGRFISRWEINFICTQLNRPLFFFFIYVGCPGQLTRTTTIPHGPLDILQVQEQVRHRGGDRRAYKGSNPKEKAEQVHEWSQQLYLKCTPFNAIFNYFQLTSWCVVSVN